MTKKEYGSENKIILQISFGRWFFQFGRKLKVYYDFKSLLTALGKTLKKNKK